MEVLKRTNGMQEIGKQAPPALVPSEPLLPVGGARTSCEIMMVTPDMALKLIEASFFDRQRRVTQSRVQYLSAEMKAGRFVPGTPVYFGMLPSGKALLLNGQHTLWAIVDCDELIELCLITRQVADEDEAGALYAVFDIHRVRSFKDSIHAFEGEIPDNIRSRAVSAIAIIEGRLLFTQGSIKSRGQVVDNVKKYESAILLLRNMLSAGATSETRTFILRTPILAIVLVTLKEQPSAAVEFWGDFLKDDGLKKGSPQRALLSYLRNVMQRQTPSSGSQHRQNYGYAAALAWNAAWDQRELDFVKAGSVVTFKLKGTSYAEGRPEIEAKPSIDERTALLMRDFAKRNKEANKA